MKWMCLKSAYNMHARGLGGLGQDVPIGGVGGRRAPNIFKFARKSVKG